MDIPAHHGALTAHSCTPSTTASYKVEDYDRHIKQGRNVKLSRSSDHQIETNKAQTMNAETWLDPQSEVRCANHGYPQHRCYGKTNKTNVSADAMTEKHAIVKTSSNNNEMNEHKSIPHTFDSPGTFTAIDATTNQFTVNNMSAFVNQNCGNPPSERYMCNTKI